MFKIFTKKSKYMEKVNFEVRLVHSKPVELIQMANSLISLQNIVASHISKECGLKDSKILLSGVKEGSDIYELILDFGTGILPLAEGINSISDAINHIKSYLNINKKTIEDIKDSRHFNTANCEHIKNFVAPVINDDSNANIQIAVNGNTNAPIVIINNIDAKTIHDNAEYIKKIISNDKSSQQDEKKVFEKVLIKMHKATDSIRQVKDSAYCDDIVKGKAIATLFENIEDKKEVLVNPFSNLFLVDIEIVKLNDEVKLYRVLKLHNIIESDEL